ncbi:hypothetical protein ACIBKY_51175 [Nonomuraea sp. NPDC050394]|uniref:hypothetical protein n=1 Tax=Nonomuraea sp. NPDC050394 TaxID=3364363 RepID=UPI0037BCDACA
MIRLLALLLAEVFVAAVSWYGFQHHPTLGVIILAIGTVTLILPGYVAVMGLGTAARHRPHDQP